MFHFNQYKEERAGKKIVEQNWIDKKETGEERGKAQQCAIRDNPRLCSSCIITYFLSPPVTVVNCANIYVWMWVQKKIITFNHLSEWIQLKKSVLFMFQSAESVCKWQDWEREPLCSDRDGATQKLRVTVCLCSKKITSTCFTSSFWKTVHFQCERELFLTGMGNRKSQMIRHFRLKITVHYIAAIQCKRTWSIDATF